MPKPMPKSGPQKQQPKPGWWKRQEATTKLLIEFLSGAIVILIVALVLVATLATGNESSGAGASSTTLTSEAQGGTTTTAAEQAGTTTTATAEGSGTATTTSAEESASTTTTEAASTTTVVTATSDTADHAADYRAQHPSTESFTDSNWAILNQAPASHLGAAVDVIGQAAGQPTLDPGTGYLTWQLSIPAGGTEMQAFCRTNVNLDQSLLSAGNWVEVKGVVVGAQQSGTSNGTTVYVETVEQAAAPATTPAS